MSTMYPVHSWECGVCGKENPGDIGHCMNARCRGGSIIRHDSRPSGGLMNGAIPYFPVWHVEKSLQQDDMPPYEIHDGYLPCPEKYPHHNSRLRV